MRLVMMGTGPFALPTFRRLYETAHQVVALVTGPVRTHRGKQVEPASLLREVAGERGTPILDPEDVNADEFAAPLRALAADLFIVCDYGQILSPATLGAARLGGINLHASLLPKYRGAAPINWAIYHGETETGVTVIHMTPRLDAGPCIAQLRVDIGPDETAGQLEARLADLGTPLVCETIDRLERGDARPLAQDAALASRAPRLKKTDGEIDWRRSAAAIKNQIRAFEPWPRSYTFWHRPDGTPVRLIVPSASVGSLPTAASTSTALPGTVLEAADDRLTIATGEGVLAPATIQPAGKREMPVAEFLRGHHVRPGDRFGPEA
ncbi:MAG: methionyl-tRNA formyltransferase [Thermoguttaceae bacterium]